MSNTLKFYGGFLIALALLIALAYETGYRMGIERERHNRASVPQSLRLRTVAPTPEPSATP